LDNRAIFCIGHPHAVGPLGAQETASKNAIDGDVKLTSCCGCGSSQVAPATSDADHRSGMARKLTPCTSLPAALPARAARRSHGTARRPPAAAGAGQPAPAARSLRTARSSRCMPESGCCQTWLGGAVTTAPSCCGIELGKRVLPQRTLLDVWVTGYSANDICFNQVGSGGGYSALSQHLYKLAAGG